MEQISHNEQDSKRKKIEGIIEKAKKYLKIGSVASLGLFLQSCTDQEKNALFDSIKNYDVDGNKNIHHDFSSSNESESLPKDSKNRSISYEEFLNSGLYSDYDNSEHAQIILNEVELKKEINDIQSKVGNYGKLSDSEREKLLALKINNLEYLQGLRNAYSPEGKYEELKSEIQNAYAVGDEQREWLHNVVKSNEYKKRLSGEFGDTQTFDMNYKIRKNKITDKDYDVMPRDTFTNDPDGSVLGSYDPESDKVEITKKATDRNRSTPVHEFAHDMTFANILLSKKALTMYTESFDQSRMSQEELEMIEYLKDPTERDARKKELEFELEKLGVKKYGEEFTDDHYRKMIELQKEQQFSDGADQFIRMTKPEYFRKIMNEIAERKTANLDEDSNKA